MTHGLFVLKGSTHGNLHFRGESFSVWSAARQSQCKISNTKISVSAAFNAVCAVRVKRVGATSGSNAPIRVVWLHPFSPQDDTYP
ncbi:hypothetical protein Y032_0092g2597 [Ancylostoma ceylanicum]|uniref:Uncharacterized protein n=1 Tax=Ancylostoma ceylanicum TaxID=53326 RepID=A0A016TMI0_9BILA|nr:hypothetical protein Y032_0092g2597 [Ancylostoma ceylanicum]